MILFVIFLCLFLFILGPGFFMDGGILLLDYIAAPFDQNIAWTDNFGNLPALVSSIIGYEWGTKIIFASILLLSAGLGYLFSIKIFNYFSLVSYRKTIIFFAITFFLINPFLYERMMVQPTIYLGIVLIGYALYSILFLQKYYKWVGFGIFGGLAINLFLHASFMIALILGLYIIFFVRKKGDLIGILGACSVIILINLHWILPAFFYSNKVVNNISAFSAAHFEAFATNALEPLNVWFTNIFLYGFWGERYINHYVNVEFLSSLWFVAGFVLIGIFGLGMYFAVNFRKEIIFLGILFFVALIFSVGIASDITRDVTIFMAEKIPFWQGYREPQKWTGILMIIEGIFFIFGLIFLFQKFGKDKIIYWCLCVSIFGVLLIWSPGPLNGFHNQLKTTVYPMEFFQFRNQKIAENFSQKILILPWHSYIGCSWMGRPTVANPMQKFFSEFDIITADNVEVGKSLYSQSKNEQSRKIEDFLQNHNAPILSDLSINSIFLMKNCANFKTYDWLKDLPECRISDENDAFIFYECSHFSGN